MEQYRNCLSNPHIYSKTTVIESIVTKEVQPYEKYVVNHSLLEVIKTKNNHTYSIDEKTKWQTDGFEHFDFVDSYYGSDSHYETHTNAKSPKLVKNEEVDKLRKIIKLVNQSRNEIINRDFDELGNYYKKPFTTDQIESTDEESTGEECTDNESIGENDTGDD